MRCITKPYKIVGGVLAGVVKSIFGARPWPLDIYSRRHHPEVAHTSKAMQSNCTFSIPLPSGAQSTSFAYAGEVAEEPFWNTLSTQSPYLPSL